MDGRRQRGAVGANPFPHLRKDAFADPPLLSPLSLPLLGWRAALSPPALSTGWPWGIHEPSCGAGGAGSYSQMAGG